MGTQQKRQAPPSTAKAGVSQQFPVGLRVLMVDDDVTCLTILEQMLRRCMYSVTSCSRATVALNLLRERKGCFDVVLSDVHMPDMDGFKLLELVGLEMDLPVIMMSADGRTSAVMQGIRHGACDYLIKPIREEELKNLWQHVVRKKWNENKEHEQSCRLNDIERPKLGSDDTENASFNSEKAEVFPKMQKKRRDENEEDYDTDNDDSSAVKKPRVVWSVELHQQFVSAVNHIGIDKAVPKRILELMNVPGLTRENVASHLQKFRLYLKRLSAMSQHQGGISVPYCGPIEHNAKMGSFGGFNFQSLAASRQIPPQTLAALQAELLGRPTGTLLLTGTDQPIPGSLQVPKSIIGSCEPMIRCTSNISKQFQQHSVADEDVHSGLGSWVAGGLGGVGRSGGNIFMGMLQNQQQQQEEKQFSIPESSSLINVQPSCLIFPSQPSPNFHLNKNLASVDQNFSFDRNSAINYSVLSSQPSSPLFGAESFASSGSMNPNRWTDSVARQLPLVPCNIGNNNIQDNFSTRVDQSLDQGPLRSFGFISKDISIPSRFAVDESESIINNQNHKAYYMDNNGRRVKKEPSGDFAEKERVGIPVLQNYSTSGRMSVISE